MKTLLMMLLLVSLVSCGKSGSRSTSSTNTELEEREEAPRREEAESPEEPQVEAVDGYLEADGVEETELLNVTVNIPMALSGDRITFQSSKSVQDSGSRFNCSFAVQSGEIWHVRKVPNGLELELPNGSRQNLKPVSAGEEVLGSWLWSGTENGVKLKRRYTFLANAMVINQDCER